MLHFGVEVRRGSRHGLRIERESYAQISKRNSIQFPRALAPDWWEETAHWYEDSDHRVRTDAWCLEHQARVLENFDLNMAYFAALNPSEFKESVASASARCGLEQIVDLADWDGRAGVYVMVLDDYCQVYVGVSRGGGGIRRRIQKHWSSSKAFDRLLWGDVSSSILSIDSFRALDTTRIFAAEVPEPYGVEEETIRAFPEKFVLNRLVGGTGKDVLFAASLGANIMRTRSLRPGSEVSALAVDVEAFDSDANG